MSTPEELAWEAEFENAIEQMEISFAPPERHERHCPKWCPYPDTSYVAPGAQVPKCRGGDCTLCDEIDEEFCACLIIRAVRKDMS